MDTRARHIFRQFCVQLPLTHHKPPRIRRASPLPTLNKSARVPCPASQRQGPILSPVGGLLPLPFLRGEGSVQLFHSSLFNHCAIDNWLLTTDNWLPAQPWVHDRILRLPVRFSLTPRFSGVDMRWWRGLNRFSGFPARRQ